MSFREPMAHVRYGKNTELAGATPGVVRPMSTREAVFLQKRSLA